jgi:TRAP-type C4-dicarboxylate transport system substrate-binding protein
MIGTRPRTYVMGTRFWDSVTPEDVAAFERHEDEQREKLAARVDAAVEKIRELEAELDALADEIRHGD